MFENFRCFSGLTEECGEAVRIVAHRRMHDCARLEVDAALVSARVRPHSQATALSREIEQLEYIVNSDVLKRAFDCHLPSLGCSEPAVLAGNSVIRVELKHASESPRGIARSLEIEQRLSKDDQGGKVINVLPQQRDNASERISRRSTRMSRSTLK